MKLSQLINNEIEALNHANSECVKISVKNVLDEIKKWAKDRQTYMECRHLQGLLDYLEE